MGKYVSYINFLIHEFWFNRVRFIKMWSIRLKLERLLWQGGSWLEMMIRKRCLEGVVQPQTVKKSKTSLTCENLLHRQLKKMAQLFLQALVVDSEGRIGKKLFKEAMDTGTSFTSCMSSRSQASSTQFRMPSLGGDSLPVRERVPSIDQVSGRRLRMR